MSIIEEIGAYIEEIGLGVVAQNIFLNTFPDQPDDLITITQVGGMPQILPLNDYYLSYQFRVRSVSHLKAQGKIDQIYNLLEKDRRFVTAKNRIVIVRNLRPPFFLLSDDNERANYVLNVEFLTRVNK